MVMLKDVRDIPKKLKGPYQDADIGSYRDLMEAADVVLEKCIFGQNEVGWISTGTY